MPAPHLLFCDAAPAMAAASSDATMFTLDSVTFVGNQRVTTDTLNGVVGLQNGQKVNRDSIVQAFQNVHRRIQEGKRGRLDPADHEN